MRKFLSYLIPYRSLDLYTDLSPEQVYRCLEEAANGRAAYRGRATKKGYLIVEKVIKRHFGGWSSNSFVPFSYLTAREGKDETVIRVRSTLRPGTLLIVAPLYLIFSILFAAGVFDVVANLISLLMGKGFFSEGELILGIPLYLGLQLMLFLAFHLPVKRLRERIMEWTNAR